MKLIAASFLLISITLLGIAIQSHFGTQREKASLEKINVLIAQIALPPESTFVGETQSARPEIAGHYLIYKTSLGFEDIQRFYDRELGKLGFKRYKEFGTFLGQHSLFYCSKQFDAAIDYYDDTTRKFNLRLSISWERDLTISNSDVRTESGCSINETPTTT